MKALLGFYDRPDIVDTILKTKVEPPKCTICGRGKINFIAGLNLTSEYATYDLGMFKPQYCPMCGKKL